MVSFLVGVWGRVSVCLFWGDLVCFEWAEWDGGFQVDGGGILMGGAFCLEGALYWKDYMLALLACIFGS